MINLNKYKKKRKLIGLLVILILLAVWLVMRGWGQYRFLVVTTGSMQPKLKVGSLILIGKTDAIGVGDIITFKMSNDANSLTTHRVISAVEENGNRMYKTKGDAARVADTNLVSGEEVLGKMIVQIPGIGFPLVWAKTPMGMTALVVIPAGIIIYEETKSLKITIGKYYKKYKKHKKKNK